MQYSEKLRELADYLDARPDLAEKMEGAYQYPHIYVYAQDFEDFQELCSTLGGFEKDGYGGGLTATHRKKLDFGVAFQVAVSVSGVCERKPKLDDEGNPVMVPKQAFVPTGELEPEYEWECPTSWLDK